MLTMTRRRMLVGGSVLGCGCALHAASSGLGLVTPALAADGGLELMKGGAVGPVKSAGCMVKAEDFRFAKEGGASAPRGFTVGDQSFPIAASSGNRAFDRAMAETLYQISLVFGVTPTFGFVRGGNVQNAFATALRYKPDPGDDPLPEREHGTVIFGDGMVAYMQSKGSQNMVASVLAICGHEFGHIVQYNYAYDNQPLILVLNGDQPTVKRGELHADYLLGYYVATAKARNPNVPAAEVAKAALVIGDRNFESRDHHGTPEERGAAVYEGYRASAERNLKFEDAAIEGLRYVGAIT